MTFRVKDYWPDPGMGKPIVYTYIDGGKVIKSVYHRSSLNPELVYEADFLDGNWLWSWMLDYNSPRGVIEVGDITVADRYHAWFGTTRTIKFWKGKEIIWGNIQEVGDEIYDTCIVNPFTSTFPTLPSKGWQRVKFVGHYQNFTTQDGKKQYSDVIEFIADQAWSGNPSTGIRFWMAKGIGNIQIQFRSDEKPSSDILVADILKY